MACVLRTLCVHVLSNQLSHIYKVNKEVFNRDDPDAIKRYFRMSKQFAFYNLTLLAKNGQDFLHAIANMRRQKDKGAGALYCCAQTGVMDSNALSCAEIRLEVNGFNDTLHANEILSKLLLLVLGNSGLIARVQTSFEPCSIKTNRACVSPNQIRSALPCQVKLMNWRSAIAWNAPSSQCP